MISMSAPSPPDIADLIIFEELFRLGRPEIYNVSPQSHFEGMTKISYEDVRILIKQR